MKCPYKINTTECEGRTFQDFGQCDRDLCPLFYRKPVYLSGMQVIKEDACKRADREGEK